MIFMPNMCR